MSLEMYIYTAAVLSAIATLLAVGSLTLLLCNLGQIWPIPLAVLLLSVVANLGFWIADIPRQISTETPT